MLKKFGIISEKEVNELQKKWNIKLPNDYKNYLLNNNGGTTDGEVICFQVKHIDEAVALGTLFSVINENEDLEINTWCEEYKNDLEDGMIIIGHAMGSGIILLIEQDDWNGIYFWDNTLDYEDSTEEDCVYLISNTFKEFYENLFEE